MKILITGATGFIGSNLTNKLINLGYKVFCTLLENEINPYERSKVIPFVVKNNNIEELIIFFKENQINGIVHFASFVQSGLHASSDIERLIDSNVKFGTIILEAAAKANVSWFINTGTYWQNYGNTSYSPVNLYAATKQAFESIAQYYAETSKIKFITLRLFETYGENDNRPKIFNLWHKYAQSGEVLDMTLGEQIIDISYIDDIIDAYLLLIDHLSSNSQEVKNKSLFFVKAVQRYTLKELSKIFEETTSQKLNINWGGIPYSSRVIFCPIEEGETVPGWKPKVLIEEGIKRVFPFNDQA